MRKLLIALFIIIFHHSHAQTTNAVYPFAFLVDNEDLVGTTIPIYSESFSIAGTISFKVESSAFTSFNYMETKFEIVDGSTVLYAEDGPSFSRSSDFYNNANLSNAKDYSLNIPKDVTTSIGTDHPNAKLIVRYRYKILGSASWLPSSGYYRGDSSNEYGFKDTRQRATIAGPNEIEIDGLYSVVNASSVELRFEDVSAPPIATLTDLGGGEYKVTRIGNSTGRVYLVALSQDNVETVKNIAIKASAPIITGPSEVCTDGIYTIQYASSVTLENATGIATLTDLGNGQWKVTKTGDGEVVLKAQNETMSNTKEINVGVSFEIGGKKVVRPSETHVYTVPNDIGLTNISFNVGGGQILSSTSHSVRVKIYNTGPGGELPILFIQATATTQCGSVTMTLTPNMQPPLDGPISPDL